MMQKEKYNILYVDDEASNLRVFKTVFKRHYDISTALSAAKGLKILEEHPIRLIITDQRMPRMSGVEFLKQVKQKWPDVKIILLTAFADIEVVKKAINEIGVFRYLNKPYDFREMKALIDGALELYRIDVDEKKASNLMKKEANKFLNIFKSISDVFIRVNNDDYIEMVSPSVVELFGYSPEEVIGKKCVNVFTDGVPLNNDFVQIKEIGFSNNFETTLYTKDKSRVHVLINSRFHTNEDGTPLGIDHLVRDITAFKLQQKAIEENEFKLKNFFDNAPFGIVLNDIQGRFIEINPEFSRFSGYSVEELNNLSYQDLTPPDYATQEQIQLNLLKSNNVYSSYEKEFFHKDGHRYPVLLDGVKTKDKNGEEFIWSVVQDISKQKETEGIIENQRERLTLAINAAHLGIWDWDINIDKLIWDDKIYSMYGVMKTDHSDPNDVWISGVHPEDKDSVKAAIVQALKNEKSLDTEFRVIWPDKSVHHIHAMGKVMRDNQCTPIRMIGTIKDISETKETKIMLEALRNVQSSFITESNPQIPFDKILDILLNVTGSEYGFIGEILKDKDKKPYLKTQASTNISCNKQTATLYKKNDSEGLKFKSMEMLFGKILTTGKPVIFNTPQTDLIIEGNPKGQPNMDSFMGLPFYDKDKLIGMVGVANRLGGYNKTIIDKLELLLTTCSNLLIAQQNLEKKQKIKQELINSEALLKTQNKELEQFAYIASHDLQEPLNTVSSFVDLFLEEYSDQLDDKADMYLNFIQQSTKHMKSLVTGLLEYSQIGVGRQLKNVNCNEILEAVKEDLHLLIKEKGAIIKSVYLPDLQAYPIELKQLFQNLISNALKYSKQDCTTVITISAEKLENGWLFKCKDNGIGMDEKYKEKIFIIFQRLHNKDDYGGTGIGLAYCKKIVALHNGEIWMESQPDVGSIFYFTINNKEK